MNHRRNHWPSARQADPGWDPPARRRPVQATGAALVLTVAILSWSLGLAKVVSATPPGAWAPPAAGLAHLPGWARRLPAPAPAEVGPVAAPAVNLGRPPASPGASAPLIVSAERVGPGPSDRVQTAGQTQVPYLGYVDRQAQAPGGLPLTGPFVKWGQTSSQLSLFCAFQDRHYPRHTGVDLLVDPGAEVLATLSGVVVWAADNGPYGNLVVIENGGWQVWLAHLSAIAVTAGETVIIGQPIGASGGQPGTPGAGSTGGPHLHYAIRYFSDPTQPWGVWVDPTSRLPMELVRYSGCTRDSAP